MRLVNLFICLGMKRDEVKMKPRDDELRRCGNATRVPNYPIRLGVNIFWTLS
jgi:hypothetical protein